MSDKLFLQDVIKHSRQQENSKSEFGNETMQMYEDLKSNCVGSKAKRRKYERKEEQLELALAHFRGQLESGMEPEGACK